VKGKNYRIYIWALQWYKTCMGKINTQGHDIETIRKRFDALSELIAAVPSEATEALHEVEEELAAFLMDLQEARDAYQSL
jgi:hypothetical protein